MRDTLLNVLNDYLLLFPEEKERQMKLVNYLQNHNSEQITDWNNFDGHVVAGGFIYAKKENKFLVLYHNDLKITKDSELYRVLNILFDNSMSNNPQIDIMSINCATPILSINLFYRQLERYNRTNKKYGDDNTIWQFDRLHLEDIQSTLNNENFINLLNETISLYEQSKIQKNL